MVTLALALLLAQTPQHRLFLQPNLPQGPDFAFFEAFPTNGAGTTAACSTTAPTGVRGEALTFARTGAATCTKTATGGLATTGIANGDLVVMASNQPRVEYDSAGVLGLRVESSRLNNVIRSEEFDNAAWATETRGGAGVLSVTANAATAPDGLLTADRITFGATSVAADSSLRFMGGGCGTPCAMSVYVKGVSGSGTIDLASATGASATCSYVSTSWTRCTAVLASAGFWGIGNLAFYNGGTTRGAQDVYVWGAQGETASYATSYIPTVASAVARSSEVGARFPLSGITTTMSMASTVWTVFNMTTTGPQWLSLETTYGEATPKALGYSNAGFANTFIAGAFLSTGVGWTSGSHRMSMDTGRNARFDATATTTAAVTLSAPPTVVVLGGNGVAGFPCDCIQSRVQVDPSETRAR